MLFLFLVTLTFKLVQAMDQTRLLCEFGANPFSGSRDISYTKKRQTDGAKNRTFHSSLHAAKTKMTRSKTARNKQPAACERGHINVLKLHNTVE